MLEIERGSPLCIVYIHSPLNHFSSPLASQGWILADSRLCRQGQPRVLVPSQRTLWVGSRVSKSVLRLLPCSDIGLVPTNLSGG